MAGTNVITSREQRERGKGSRSARTEVVTIDWTADAAAATIPDLSLVLDGYLVKVITNPVATVSEVTSITTVADSAGSLAGKYFTISSAGNAVNYYVWFTVAGVGVDPAPGGKTAIGPVDVALNATAPAVATALNTTINAHADFNSTVVSDVVTVTHAAPGYATDAANVNVGFTISVTTQGIAPTDNYDITLGDPSDSALDVLGSALLNRDFTTTEQVYPKISGSLVPILLSGTYTLSIANNSVNSASGTIVLYLVDKL